MSRMHPGRIRPGVGLGVRAYLRQMGLMPTSPISALRESVLSVRGLLDSEEVTLESRAHRLDGVHLDFPPQERLPLYVGAVYGRALRLSGEVADGPLGTVQPGLCRVGERANPRGLGSRRARWWPQGCDLRTVFGGPRLQPGERSHQRGGCLPFRGRARERPRPGARRSRRSLRTARPGRHGSSRQRDARPVDKRVGRGWRSGRVRKGATQPLTGGSRLGGPVAVSHRTGRGGRPFNGPPGPSQTRSQGTRITGGAIQRRLSMIGGQRKEVMTLMARTKYDHAWPHPGVPSWV